MPISFGAMRASQIANIYFHAEELDRDGTVAKSVGTRARCRYLHCDTVFEDATCPNKQALLLRSNRQDKQDLTVLRSAGTLPNSAWALSQFTVTRRACAMSPHNESKPPTTQSYTIRAALTTTVPRLRLCCCKTLWGLTLERELRQLADRGQLREEANKPSFENR